MKSVIDVVSKLRQTSVLRRIGEVEWNTPESSSPFVVELDPTAACDLACPGCISEDIIAEGGRFTNERLLALADEMADAGVKAVILIGGGEPLAHPAIGQHIARLAERGLAIGLTTNGSFIHRHLPLIAEHVFWTRVSMDAASEDLFNKLRPAKGGRGKFRQICSNIEALATKKKGLLGYSFLVQSPADGPGIQSNAHEIVAAAKLARELGCDYFEVKPSYQWRGDVAHALMVHPPEVRAQAAEQIAELEALRGPSFEIYTALNMQASLEGAQSLQLKSYTHCPSAQLRTLVTPKGAYVCPYWRGKEAFKVGDATQNSFADIWQGDHRKTVMGRLNPSQDCGFHCLRHRSNEQMIALKNELTTGAVEPESDYDPFI